MSRRLLCLALALTPASVGATPAPLLAPSGTAWLGPLTPATPQVIRQGRGLVLVDPASGRLWVEAVDGALPGPGPEAAIRRVYHSGRWHWTTDERLAESTAGLQITRLGEVLVFASAAPLAQELGAWPVGTRFEAGGRVAQRSTDGWLVDEPGAQTLYDDQGRPLWREDARGLRVTWTWEMGLLAGIGRDGGGRLAIQVDGAGRPSVVTGPDGVPRYLEHQDGRLVRAGPVQQETRYTYDDEGLLDAITWADLSQVQVARGPSGQVTSLVGPGPRRATFTWTPEGFEVRTGTGAPTRLTWTPDGYTVRDPAGAQVRVLLSEGQLSGWQDPGGAELRLTRDPRGRITAIDGATTWRLGWRGDHLGDLVDPGGAGWRLERTQAGDLKRVVDPDGRTLDLLRDNRGALIGVDPGTGPTRLERDSGGRPTRIQAATGATTRVAWQADGVDVTDPSGQAVTVEGLTGVQLVLTSRLGEVWTLWRDALGRPERIGLPSGQIVELQRNSLGRLGALVARQGPQVRYGWRSDGLPSRVTDTMGAATSLTYDLGTRLSGLTRPDGSVLAAQRDPRGELRAIQRGDQEWTIARDGQGHPTALGPLTWAWDVAGRWLGWLARGAELVLERTGAGRVRKVRLSDGTQLGIDSDPAGRTSRVRTASGSWSIERDPDGGVRRLRGPGVPALSIARDDRGLDTLITWAKAQRRVLRDAAGRPVRWTSSGGSALSVNGAGEGRPGLGRLPSGALAQWRHTAAESVLELLDPRGRVLLSRSVRRDARGRTASIEEPGTTTVTRWDPLGEQVAVETQEGAWSWLPGILEGPGGHAVLFDEAGRPTAAVPPVGPPAWGMPGDHLSYLTDSAGRVVGISAEQGELVELEHDPLGRLTALVQDGGRRWTLTWDPFGRLVGVTDPAGIRTTLGHGTDELLGWAEGKRLTEHLAAPGLGWIDATAQDVVEVLSDDSGSPRVVLGPEVDPTLVTWGATGMPDQDPGTRLGWRGAWSLFPGGALVDGGGAIDPVTGERTDPGWRPPWWVRTDAPIPWPRLDGTAAPWWDPGPWSAQSPWANPLGLLVQLGELSPLVEAGQLGLEDAAPGLGWLPADAAAPGLPLPAHATLDDATAALTALAIRAGASPIEPVTTRAVLQAVLAPEFAGLPPLNGLVEHPESWWDGGLVGWLATAGPEH